MAKKKKGTSKKLGKLGLAILEHFVGKVIGKNAIGKLKADYKEQAVLISALANTEERFSAEFQHTETRSSLLDIPISTVPEFKEAIRDFFNRPSDPKLADVLRQQLAGKYRKLQDGEIDAVVKQYLDILTEELAMVGETFLQKEGFLTQKDIEDHTGETVEVLKDIRDKIGEQKFGDVDQTGIPLRYLHQLPAPPADFTGRDAELAELLDKIKEGGATITGVRGMGGIGKTALALVLADKLKEEYPDAQLYLDLRGAAEEGQVPVTISEALAHVIRAYHPEAQLPEGKEELQAQYNSVLHGQHALLLMDNALDAAQVGPLIPPPGNALLVTSRQKFALPGLYPTDLDTLPPDEARALVQKIAPRVDDACADEIAKLCGCLPQALRLAATALAETIDLRPETYLEDMKEEKKRLKLVDASLSLSVKLLDEELQTRWYALGVFPDSFEWTSAMAVWDVEEESTRESLSRLVRYSLVDWDEASGRYKLHDLARVYARAQVGEGEKTESEYLFASHFKDLLNAANTIYMEGGEKVLLGLALYDLETANIQAGQRWAVKNMGEDERAARLASNYSGVGGSVLYLRLHVREQITWLEKAMAAAEQLEDNPAQGVHLGNLGIAHADLGDPQTAIKYYEQALEIAREIGDRQYEGTWLGNLGIAHRHLGDPKTAIHYHQQALAISQESGNRRAEGQDFSNLGIAHSDLGDPKTAIKYYEQALEIAREIGDRRTEGAALGNLGIAHADLGDPKTAIKYHEQALEISREISDRRGEGQDLGNLGNAHSDLGDHHTAIQYCEQRLEIAREIGDRRSEGNALGSLGMSHSRLGDPNTAIKYYVQALEIAKEIGDRRMEGLSLSSLGLANADLGDPKTAIQYFEQCLEIARDLGNRSGEATTSWNLGLIYEEEEDLEKSIPLMQVCVDYLREIGHSEVEERAAYVEELKKRLE